MSRSGHDSLNYLNNSDQIARLVGQLPDLVQHSPTVVPSLHTYVICQCEQLGREMADNKPSNIQAAFEPISANYREFALNPGQVPAETVALMNGFLQEAGNGRIDEGMHENLARLVQGYEGTTTARVAEVTHDGHALG